MPNVTAWQAAGLLFENCNCQLVCPGHIHFTQLCTHERCQGYWAIRFESGRFGDTPLAGLRAVVIYDTPQLMSSGGWTEGLYIDPVADDAQRAAIEAILSGAAGGPWEVLGRFVANRLPTQFVPIEITEEDGTKGVSITGRLRSVIAAIRGRDRSQPVRFENIYNQIHNSSQVLARGDTDYHDGSQGPLRIENRGSHGLWSRFNWKVE
ncbi:MAG TPA: DUF1326 domain-containing protein [Terriglobales bacterium]|nr:DUF1326 domain-containing protein [Terriglobales bacterium]